MASFGMGWHRDNPDIRDLHSEHDRIVPHVTRVKTSLSADYVSTTASAPSSVDLRQWDSPVEDQGQLGSCTAHASVGMYEHYMRRVFGHHVDLSRLFVYKATRDLMGVRGDTGAQLRDAMRALTLVGAPDEKHWPYIESKFDVEPSAMLYSIAANFKALHYYRLDPAGTTPQQVVDAVRKSVASGLPSMFGFTVYSSFPMNSGIDVPMPKTSDSVDGGHAVLTVGYDDNHKVGGVTVPSWLVRNSWGPSWAMNGYFWLPYDYTMRTIATDYWSMVDGGFVDLPTFA